MDGALALAELRGPVRFHEPIGLQVSAWLSTHILISCVAASIRILTGLIQLRSNLELVVDWWNLKWQACGWIIKYAHLQCDLKGGSNPEPEV